MKKIHGIFFETIAILLPILLLTNLIVLGISYSKTYETSLQHSVNNITRAAKVIEDYVGIYDLTRKSDVDICNESLSALCREFDITYAYVQKIDVKNNSETYISIGVGNGASEDFIEQRHAGDTVVGSLNQEQIDAANNVTDAAVLHETVGFDDTLVCYVPLKHFYNSELKTFEESEKTGYIVAAEMSFTEVKDGIQSMFNSLVLIVLSLSFVMTVSFAFVMYKMIARPASKISSKMSNYMTHHDKDDRKIEIKGNNEFADMARNFNAMTDEIKDYINDIEKLNKEKHMQEAELSIATNIQLGLLKPMHYCSAQAHIDATILPAKIVGGDLYDYQVLEDGRIDITIADVSGKGISSALFMSRALTLIHMYSELGYSPKQILYAYNNTLASQNPKGLFITTFVARYDPSTRQLTYSNAGHNNPYVISDFLVELTDARGMAAGIFANAEYEEKTITLSDGDALLLYTDGVNEAQNKNGEMFGNERLEAILATHTGKKKRNIIKEVIEGIHTFVHGAEQSDDITILCFKTQGSFYHKELNLTNNVEELLKIRAEIEKIPDISDQLKLDLNLMAEEIFVNQCHYAYKGRKGEIQIIIHAADRVHLTFIDSGMPYDPTRQMLDIEEYDHENTVGGLGKFITFQMADAYHYELKDNKNYLYIEKSPQSEDEQSI